MITLKELISRHAQPGRIEAIYLRPVRLEPPVLVQEAVLEDAGLEGDHSRPGKRALTLIQAEHVPVIASLAGLDAVDPSELRRNLLISGLNLSALRGHRFKLGACAEVELTGPCAPCSRMEKALGFGAYTAMRGHGGWCARVISPGPVAVGMDVTPIQSETEPQS